MQDHELTHDEFGEDLEADSFEFDFETSDEFDLEAGGESPEDKVEGSIADAVPAGVGMVARTGQAVVASHRQQSGRWTRRGNTVVLFGI